MEVKDIFLTPVYLVIIYVIALYFRPKATNALDQRYYLPALTVKLFGAISMGLVYTFYYHGGDTISYHDQSKIVYQAFWEDPTVGIKLIFSHGQYDPATWRIADKIRWYHSATEFFVVRIATIISLFTFNAYTVVAMIFALLSFSGIWAMFKTFMKMYPVLHRKLAIATLFIPSVFFWGSGLMKDSLCIGSLGWLFFAFYEGLIERKNLIRAGVIIAVASWVILSTKPYIIFSFVPPAIFWVIIENGARIKNKVIRALAAPIFLAGGVFAAVFGVSKLTEGDDRYSLENVAERTKITADYIYRISVQQEGSAYKLGELDGTIQGTLKLAPQAINVSLFRPYLWEVNNPIMLLSALEATWFIYLTLTLLLRTGVSKTFRLIAFTPLLTFCFVFAMVFSMAVGVSTNNFGTLVRYRIHMMPFYLAALYISNYQASLSRAKRTLVRI
jgi:hypothetical protein